MSVPYAPYDDKSRDDKHSKEAKAARDAVQRALSIAAAAQQSAAAVHTTVPKTSSVTASLSSIQTTTDGSLVTKVPSKEKKLNLEGHGCPICLELNNPMKLITTCSHSLCANCAPQCHVCPLCQKPFKSEALVDNLQLTQLFQLLSDLDGVELVSVYKSQQAEIKKLAEDSAKHRKKEQDVLNELNQRLKSLQAQYDEKIKADAASRRARKEENNKLSNAKKDLEEQMKVLHDKLNNGEIIKKKLDEEIKKQLEDIQKLKAQDTLSQSKINSLNKQLLETQRALRQAKESVAKFKDKETIQFQQTITSALTQKKQWEAFTCEKTQKELLEKPVSAAVVAKEKINTVNSAVESASFIAPVPDIDVMEGLTKFVEETHASPAEGAQLLAKTSLNNIIKNLNKSIEDLLDDPIFIEGIKKNNQQLALADILKEIIQNCILKVIENSKAMQNRSPAMDGIFMTILKIMKNESFQVNNEIFVELFMKHPVFFTHFSISSEEIVKQARVLFKQAVLNRSALSKLLQNKEAVENATKEVNGYAPIITLEYLAEMVANVDFTDVSFISELKKKNYPHLTAEFWKIVESNLKVQEQFFSKHTQDHHAIAYTNFSNSHQISGANTAAAPSSFTSTSSICLNNKQLKLMMDLEQRIAKNTCSYDLMKGVVLKLKPEFDFDFDKEIFLQQVIEIHKASCKSDHQNFQYFIEYKRETNILILQIRSSTQSSKKGIADIPPWQTLPQKKVEETLAKMQYFFVSADGSLRQSNSEMVNSGIRRQYYQQGDLNHKMKK